MKMSRLFLICLVFGAVYCGQEEMNMVPGRSTIVHLFEWKWSDIAEECERFLGPKGFGGVQVSPASENLILHLEDGTRPWYERYQPMSYKIETRSGNEEQFLNMTRRCNDVGVRHVIEATIYPDISTRSGLMLGKPGGVASNNSDQIAILPNTLTIKDGTSFVPVSPAPTPFKPEHSNANAIYVDVVFNHMTGGGKENIGTAGSKADIEKEEYYGVPYSSKHFHSDCAINDWYNVEEVRRCRLVGLKDLNHGLKYVRNKIINHLNRLVSLGVAGFRVDAAKHMWPADLKKIYDRVNNLNTEFGFEENSRPYFVQEVNFNGNEPIKHSDYTGLGDVTEFRVGTELRGCFTGQNPLKYLVSWGESWNLSPSDKVLVFIDNHDTQRNNQVLTYKDSTPYKAAIAFMLAHTYGSPRIMSSYYFDNEKQGPPADNESILSPTINKDNTCGNGWVCEHRWRQIYQMVAFRNAAGNTKVQNWWDNGNNQIAFSRGDKAFVVFNVEGKELNEKLQTALPKGDYCDVISGEKQGKGCTGTKVSIDNDGKADIHLNAETTHLAIHVGPESSLQAVGRWSVTFHSG